MTEPQSRQTSSALTRQQDRALRRPALIAEECAHPRYASQTALGSVVLTVNTGYE